MITAEMLTRMYVAVANGMSKRDFRPLLDQEMSKRWDEIETEMRNWDPKVVMTLDYEFDIPPVNPSLVVKE